MAAQNDARFRTCTVVMHDARIMHTMRLWRCDQSPRIIVAFVLTMVHAVLVSARHWCCIFLFPRSPHSISTPDTPFCTIPVRLSRTPPPFQPLTATASPSAPFPIKIMFSLVRKYQMGEFFYFDGVGHGNQWRAKFAHRKWKNRQSIPKKWCLHWRKYR